jgi:hypothetical protein
MSAQSVEASATFRAGAVYPLRTYSVCISGPIGELLIASTLGCCFVERHYVLASPIEVVMTKDESDAEK